MLYIAESGHRKPQLVSISIGGYQSGCRINTWDTSNPRDDYGAHVLDILCLYPGYHVIFTKNFPYSLDFLDLGQGIIDLVFHVCLDPD